MFLKTLSILALGWVPVFFAGDWKMQKTGSFKACEIDIQGNVYVIDARNDLMVFKDNDTFRRISVANQGPDPILDASNPLEVFVFFPSTGKILWFDNQLNQQSFIDIFQSGITQAAAFGRANDGGIWVMDNNTRTLKKLSKEGSVTMESIWLADFRSGKEVARIFDDGEHVVVPDGEGGIFIFDQNLQLKQVKTDQGPVVGMNNRNVYSMRGDLLLGLSLSNQANPRIDTLFRTPDSLALCAANTGFILLRGTRGIFLQKNKN
jgi:predicted secreted protein